MRSNRRRFLTQTGAAFLAAGSLKTLARAEEDSTRSENEGLPIVDTHQHLWDLSKLRLPWLNSSPKLNRSFVTKDYLAATRGLNVVKAVYMEVAVDTPLLLAEAEHVLELCRSGKGPTVAAVIGGRPESEEFAEYMARFKNEPLVKGVRRLLFDPKPGQQETFVENIRLLGQMGKSFDLCMKPQDLPLGAKLVDQCPDTRFILDHCGNADPKAFRPADKSPSTASPPQHDPDAWRRDVADLARRKNVVCKISGIVSRAPEGWTAEDLAPIVNHCLDSFGPDRVMFGGDWPVCRRMATLREWVTALREIIRPRSEQHRRKLLADNAIRFYGLE